jgi:hypothetical protein
LNLSLFLTLFHLITRLYTNHLLIFRSFPNAGSLLGSPASTPGGTRRSQLPPSGIKLPVPPPSLLNGLANVHKSASSASLNIAAVSPSAGRSDQLRESVTLPNAGQMLAAARSELLLNNGIGSNGGGIGLQKAAVAGAVRARLPPLQLPKGPAQNGNSAVKDTEKGERLGSSSSSSQNRGGQQQAAAEDCREESGPIATMASEPMPQMQPLEPHQVSERTFSQILTHSHFHQINTIYFPSLHHPTLSYYPSHPFMPLSSH